MGLEVPEANLDLAPALGHDPVEEPLGDDGPVFREEEVFEQVLGGVIE